MNNTVSSSEIKQLIIDTLNLEDITIDEIGTIEPLFVEGLGLDSIDALELGVALKKKYNINMNADDQSMRQHFESVGSLVTFINGGNNDASQ